MVGIEIPYHTELPGIQKHRKSNLHILPQSYPFLTVLHVLPDQFRTEKFRHSGRLQCPSKETTVIDERRKQRLQFLPAVNLFSKVRDLLPSWNLWILEIKHQTADRHISTLLKGQTKHPLIHMGIDPVIAVHKTHIFPGSQVHSTFPGRGQSAVGLMMHPNLFIFLPIFITDLPGTICRTIIHQNNLQILHRLIQNTVHTAVEISLHIVDRNHHANFRIIVFHSHPSPDPAIFDTPRDT